MSDVSEFADAIAEPHLGFALRPSIADLGPTPAETFVDRLTAGRLVPGYGRMGDDGMDSVALWHEQGPGLWPDWRRPPVVPDEPAPHPLAAAGPPPAVRPPKPGLQAATAAIDQTLAAPGPRPPVLRDGTRPARRSGLLDVSGFVRDVRNYLDVSTSDEGVAADASPLWKSLQMSLSGIGGALEGALNRPTLMRLPAAGLELVAATAPDDLIGDLERHALRLARHDSPRQGRVGRRPAQGQGAPAYFGPGKVAVEVARRFVRSAQGRRMTETLLAGGPRVHSPETPRGTEWAARAAAQAPRGAIPVAGAGTPADVVAGFDYQLLNAMDQWEAAFPGRAPYSAPTGEGGGNENPDFKDAAPEIPRWDVQAAASAAASITGGPVDVKAAQVLQEMGLLGTGGVGAFNRSTAAGGGGGGWGGLTEGVLGQGDEQAISMALIAPVLQVVQEVSAPLLKELPDGAPGAGISAAEKGIEEADSEKLEYVAQQIMDRLRMMIDTEKDRRGY